MQAIILAAGKSTRTYPLTLTRPKPLLKVANKTLLEHNLDNLEGAADEAILVVGYKKEMIKKHLGNKYKKIKIRYAEQKRQLGTAHALSAAEHFIKGRFFLMMGDDIYPREDIRNCAKHRYSILAARVKSPRNFGVIIQKNNILTDIVEKPKLFLSGQISTAFYSLDKEIFKCIKEIKKSERNELEMPDAIKALSKKEKIYCVKSKAWIPIAYPWDLLTADRILRKNKNLIGKNSRIRGKVINSSIGDNCIISGNVENSIIMDNSEISAFSEVKNSVIGNNVHFNGKIISGKTGAITANGEKIKIEQKFGAVIADNVLAENVVINPGCMIWPNKPISNRKIGKNVA